MTDWTSTPRLAGCDEKWVENLTGLLSNHNWSETLQPIVGKLRSGERLTIADGHVLYSHKSLHEVGQLANPSAGLIRIRTCSNMQNFNSAKRGHTHF